MDKAYRYIVNGRLLGEHPLFREGKEMAIKAAKNSFLSQNCQTIRVASSVSYLKGE